MHTITTLGTAVAGATLASMLFAAPVLAQAASAEGVWLTQEGSEMTIAPCVEGFCGYITKIVVPQRLIDKYGAEIAARNANYTDEMNPDPNLRSRPIQDLQILTLRQTAYWNFEGEVYNPEDGQTYAAYLEVMGENELKMKGCTLAVLCAEQIWVRVPQAE
jgi:uncharacterized protein (DUF2147 family)